MRRVFFLGAIAPMLIMSMATARADELGTEIDLTTFGTSTREQTSAWDGFDIEDVGLFNRGGNRANRRFYISGMLGPSFVNLAETSPLVGTYDNTVFSAGGAAGVALDRRRGALRLELEGLWRNDAVTTVDGIGTIAANNGWSVMQNVWRDVLITDRFGVYGGGGLGGGGYTLAVDAASQVISPTFAWQFGGGLIYEITNRLTFDVGYRYFHLNDVTTAVPAVGDVTTQYGASELMFTLRFYDPLRRWTR